MASSQWEMFGDSPQDGGGGGSGFDSNAFDPFGAPAQATNPPPAASQKDVLLSLLDGFVANQTPSPRQPTPSAQAPAAPPIGSSMGGFGLDNAFDFSGAFSSSAVPATALDAPTPPAPAAQASRPPAAPSGARSRQFNPMEDDGNPFVDDVMFPVTTAGLELDRKIESSEIIPGFDEFVSEQLKHTHVEPPAVQSREEPRAEPRARKTLVSSTPSLVPKIAAERAAREAEAAKAPSSDPPPPPPPTYDAIVSAPPPATERLDRRGSTSSKADEQHLWPMPFLQVRLRPPRREQAAALDIMAGGNDFLIAAPNRHGSLRVWRNADSSVDMSTDELQRYASYLSREDNDSCPAIDIPNRVEGRVTCLQVDAVRGRIWAGHATGEVTHWDAETLKFLHVFQAHRNGSVNAIVLTAYGDLWTGSSRGSLRIWKNGGKILPRSGQNSSELRRANGDRAHGRIKALLYVPGANLVWSCGIHSLALWNATTGQHLTSVGEVEKQALSVLEASYDDMWSGSGSAALQRRASGISNADSDFTSSGYSDGFGSDAGSDLGSARSLESSGQAPKSASSQLGSITSRASKLLGKGLKLGKKAVAKSVDKVYNATSGLAAEELNAPGQTHATVVDANGNVWVVYNNGIVELYAGKGQCLRSWQEPDPVSCICTVGSYVWAGLASGQIKVWDSEYEVSATWRGHRSHLVSICAVSSRVYTLCADGCLSGWHHKTPVEWREDRAARILSRSTEFLTTSQLTVFAGTWNVNQMDLGGIRSALPRWVEAGAKAADIAILGLQEVEMGARTVAESIVKETFAKGMQEKGNLAAQTWFQEILGALCKATGHQWIRAGTRQLSGILLGVYVRDHLGKSVGEVETCSVARGVMGVGGNKGTVGVSLTIHRRRLLFLCSHFAAHQNAVEKRNEDYSAAARELRLQGSDQAGVGPYRGEGSLLGDAHLAVWVGDFNYRVDMPYSQACEAAYAKDYAALRSRDQCLREMAKGATFVGFSEGELNFPPTYKFDKRTSTYDTSEKQRIPAWCDRVLYRTKRDSRIVLPGYGDLGRKHAKNFPEEPVTCVLQTYGSCHDIVESDHKPVYAVLGLAVRCVDESAHRRLAAEVMAEMDASGGDAGGVWFSEASQGESGVGGFTITNAGQRDIAFEVANDEDDYLPHLVLMTPTGGLVRPKASTTVSVGVNSDPTLSQSIHRLEQIKIRVTFWVYGLKKTTARTKVVTTRLQFERYFHSI